MDKPKTKTEIKVAISKMAVEKSSLDYQLGVKTNEARARIAELAAKIDALRWVLGQIDQI